MLCVTTGPISNALVDENRQITVTVKISNNGRKPRAVLIKGFSLEGSQNPFITQVVNIKPKSEVIRDYPVNTDSFKFNFEAFDYADVKISVWECNGTLSRELPLFYIG